MTEIPESPTQPQFIYRLIGFYHGRASRRSGARGGEKTTIFSSPPFLVDTWSGVCQSPRTHQWSSSWKRLAVKQRTPETPERDQQWLEDMGGLGLASEFEQAVSNIKMVSPNLCFPLTYLGFTGFIGNSPRAGNTLPPGATAGNFQSKICRIHAGLVLAQEQTNSTVRQRVQILLTQAYIVN